MMPLTTFLTLALAAAARAHASHWFTWTMWFYHADHDNTGECDVPELELSDQAVSIDILSNITYPGCYNFESVVNGSIPGCNPGNNETCNHQFMLGRGDYNPVANYSHLYFNQGSMPDHLGRDMTELSFTIYADTECGGYQPDGQRWYQTTGCAEGQQECADLPFTVGSFRIDRNVGEERDQTCLVVAELRNDSTRLSASIASMLGMSLLIVAMVL